MHYPDSRGLRAVHTIAGAGYLTMEEVIASRAMDLYPRCSVLTDQGEGLVASMAFNHFINGERRNGGFYIDPGGSSLSFWFPDTPRTHGGMRCCLIVVIPYCFCQI